VAVVAVVVSALAVGGTLPASAGDGPVPVPDSLLSLYPATGVSPALARAGGPVEVSVRLSEAPVAEVVAEGSTATGRLPSAATQKSRLRAVRTQQDAVAAGASAIGAEVTGGATRAANVLTMVVDSAELADIAALPGVLSVKALARYETHAGEPARGSLAEAIQVIDADELHARGLDGTGVSVAVLDSGIDFTHANLGGPGTPAAYDGCYDGGAYAQPVTGACADLFGPSAPKVKGGYDFVGEVWPNGDLAPDANPIDLDGHGTHVADIAVGRSADGSHAGLAPGADLYAVKVCSAVLRPCSGVALLQGVDWALDPNGDGDISDAVDIMNLSLGSSYGQPEDDLTLAVDNAVRAGVVAVVSAGNSADRPFIVGSPSSASRAISVAQTSLPGDKLYPVLVNPPTISSLPGNTVRYSVLQSWSPTPTGAVTAALALPPVNALGCDAAAFAGFPTGAVALVSRGTCNASSKAAFAFAAGASSVLVYNDRPGAPPSFGYGGGVVGVPTYSISQPDGRALATAVAAGPVSVTIDPSAAISLDNTMVSSSSRGPRMGDEVTKPDIGAPGAWLSAEVETGASETSFGGTSGAAPVVTGVAALVLQAHPGSTPVAVKARLLNGAAAGNATLDATGTLYPTPVSRVGSGEVRAATAVGATGLLANEGQGGGNVGLGLPHLSIATSYPVQLRLRNTGRTSRTYSLATSFRDPADQALGALTVSGPTSVTVGANATKAVKLTLRIDPARLPAWPFTTSAAETGNGAALDGPELDGWITATSGSESLRLGWQVLPHRSADVTAPTGVRLDAGGVGSVQLRNKSTVLGGGVEVFGLTGTSPELRDPAPGAPGTAGSDAAVVDLRAVGVRTDGTTLQFAVNGWDRQTVPAYPAEYDVFIDTNRDGVDDYAVYNAELGGFGVTGQTVVVVANLRGGAPGAYFYSVADFDSQNQVLTVPLAALGMATGSTFDFDVYAFDNYFSGRQTDSVQGMSWTVGSPRYSAASALTVPPGATSALTVTSDPAAGPSSQTGLLLLLADARSAEAALVTVTP